MTVDLVVRALTGVTGAGGIISQARDLQDAVSSYWRSVDGHGEEDELPF